jgi:hypothetical protein
VTTKASLHEPLVNFDFAHSLKSGMGDGGWRVASTLSAGVERYRCKKSEANVKCMAEEQGNITCQKPR